jgi:MFS family permease
VPAPSLALLIDGFRRSPLRHGRFRAFYVGSIGAALGYTMQTTVATWLMTTLTPSALMVALVQTAATLPSLLFGLVAGALADIVARRRLIFVTQVSLFAITAVLGLATLIGVIGPLMLLAMTFFIGTAFTYYLPAQQATVNDLVPRDELPRAVALGAVAFNVARAIGPALAGGLAAWIGSGSAMVVAAFFFVWMIVAARGLRSPPPAIPGIPETVWSGLASGLRFARHSPPLRAQVIRSASFTFCAGALWALLAVVARDQLRLGAGGYGALSASFGIGAVAGALAMPRFLQRSPLNAVVSAGTAAWLVAVLLLAWAPMLAVALAATALGGAAWVTVLASISAGTQTSAPGWVRGRALAMNLVSTQAGLALGGVVWGWLAADLGTQVTLAISAAALAVLHLVNYRLRLALGTEADVTPGVALPDLTIAGEPLPDDGPVLIQIEYRIAPENRESFMRVARKIERVRRRNGASAWRVFRDVAEEGRYVERFIVGSWAEYVRLRARGTVADRQAQDRINELQRPDTEIRVSRLIGLDPDSERERGSGATR